MEHPAGSVWQRQARASRGPAPEYSRAQIAAAGTAIADAEGVAAVSMRRVAAAIGTAPGSLYRYVSSRDELIDLMADAVSAEFDLSQPPTGRWLDDLIRLAHQIRGIHRRHRWLFDLAPDEVSPGPNTIDFLEYALVMVRDLDVPGRVKLEAIVMLSAVVALIVRAQATDTGPPRQDAERQAARVAYLGAVIAKGDHPHLAAALTGAAALTDAAAPPGAAAVSDQATAGDTASEDAMDGILRRVLPGLLHQ